MRATRCSPRQRTKARRFGKFGKIAANSEVHDNSTYGVLKLTLSPGRYDWEFVPMAGSRFKDAGTAACVAPAAR